VNPSSNEKVTPLRHIPGEKEGERSLNYAADGIDTFILHETLGVCIVFGRSKWRKSGMFHRIDIKNRKAK